MRNFFHSLLHILLLTGVLLSFLPFSATAKKLTSEAELFPRSKMVQVQVYFWKKVFAEVNSREGLLHDSELILPIYRKISLKGLSSLKADQKIKWESYRVQLELLDLATVMEKRKPLNKGQRALLAKFYRGITPKELRAASRRVRFQYGASNRFRKGLEISGAYMPQFKNIFKQYKIPLALLNLPHVESSFNLNARSHVGAQGMWQFMKQTALEYQMRVDDSLDERIDPFLAADAAARLLKNNYKLLGSWPLAITAYNHGQNSLRRIARKMKSKNLSYLTRHYRSDTFKFASKNYYAEFLAVWDISKDHSKYFSKVKFMRPKFYQEINLPRPLYLSEIVKFLDYSKQQLLELNPALMSKVVQERLPIPESYRLKIPERYATRIRVKDENLQHTLHPIQTYFSRQVKVKKGDSLHSIARYYEISVDELAQINHLSARNSLIHPGQFLYLPFQKLGVRRFPVSYETPLVRYVPVEKGDSLGHIARRYQVSLKQLVVINELKKNNSIRPGQQLKLPGNWLPIAQR